MSNNNNHCGGNGHNRRGNGNKSSGSSKRNNKKNNDRVVKFAPYSNNTKGSFATFDTVKEAAVVEISKTVTHHSEDIIKAVETEKHIDFNKDPYKPKKENAKKDEDQGDLDQIYGFRIKSWITRQENYESNKHKAYDIIFN